MVEILEPTEENKLQILHRAPHDHPLHPATVQLLELFEYKHLPPHLQRISKQFHDLAWRIAQEPTERGAEQTTCLRKLREAKDCAVTMAVPIGQIGSNSPPRSG